MTAPLIIAVDGTAASGKGTVARLLAVHYHFAHLDSGALYRLTALGVIEAGGDPADPAAALAAAERIDHTRACDPAIRTEQVGKGASQVGAIPAVRDALLSYQRGFAAAPPGGARGAVIDGRDIGTVICPQADAKLFVDAAPHVRAHRRWLELEGMGINRNERDLMAELLARDAADRARPIAPLRQADDAALLDTTDLGIDASFAAALALVEPRLAAKLEA